MLHYNIVVLLNYFRRIPRYTRNTNVCVKLCKQKNRLFLVKKINSKDRYNYNVQ